MNEPVSRAEVVEMGLIVRDMAIAIEQEGVNIETRARVAVRDELHQVERELNLLRAKTKTQRIVIVLLTVTAIASFVLAIANMTRP